MKCSEV